jgi:hypothetical protein
VSRVLSFVLEGLAVMLLTVSIFGLFGPWWALLPPAVYLVFVSFTLEGGAK